MPKLFQRALWTALLAAAGVFGARADEGAPVPPVGRVVLVEGRARAVDESAPSQQARDASRNHPVAIGDEWRVDRGAVLELEVAQGQLRLIGPAELAVRTVDEGEVSLALRSGLLGLRLPARQSGGATWQISTPLGQVLPGPGAVLSVEAPAAGLVVIRSRRGGGQWSGMDSDWSFNAGQGLEISTELQSGRARYRWVSELDSRLNAFLEAVPATSMAATPSPGWSDVPGYAELDRQGRWERHPQHGWIWTPNELPIGWAPFRDGRWVWMRGWGWTWVDDQAWGFAPAYSGSWLQWSGRWYWAPGVQAPRRSHPMPPPISGIQGRPAMDPNPGVVHGRTPPLPVLGFPDRHPREDERQERRPAIETVTPGAWLRPPQAPVAAPAPRPREAATAATTGAATAAAAAAAAEAQPVAPRIQVPLRRASPEAPNPRQDRRRPGDGDREKPHEGRDGRSAN